jgi:hypothetical protein
VTIALPLSNNIHWRREVLKQLSALPEYSSRLCGIRNSSLSRISEAHEILCRIGRLNANRPCSSVTFRTATLEETHDGTTICRSGLAFLLACGRIIVATPKPPLQLPILQRNTVLHPSSCCPLTTGVTQSCKLRCK